MLLLFSRAPTNRRPPLRSELLMKASSGNELGKSELEGILIEVRKEHLETSRPSVTARRLRPVLF